MKVLPLIWKTTRYLLLVMAIYALLILGLGYSLFGRTVEATRSQTEQIGKLEAISNPVLRPNNDSVLTFYALGDWGTADQNQKQVALLLEKDLAYRADRQISPFVLEAGDNVYQNGLASGWDNPEMKLQLSNVVDANYVGISYQNKPVGYHIVAGNHDYEGDLPLWETYAERRYDGQNDMPIIKSYNQHHPGIADTNDEAEYDALINSTDLIELPEIIETQSEMATFIAIDSEKMLELYSRRPDEPELQSELDAHWKEMERLGSSSKSWTFILAHHPISTFGPHGGVRDSLAHRFFRALLFFVDDYGNVGHPAYQEYIADFDNFSRRHPLIFIAGHDHSLQLNVVSDTLLQVVSGAAGKTSFVTPGEGSIYSYAELGFARFDVTPSDVWIEFVDISNDQPVLYRYTKGS
jgi:hypothetical protein